MTTKTWLAAILGGIVAWLASFLLHGLVMGATYVRYDEVFSQEQANPLWFLVAAVLVALPAAYAFRRTRDKWPSGLSGGLCFGALVGAIIGFTNFYWPLIFLGFPYYLAWCWLGIDVIVYSLMGAAFTFFIKA